ncbi:hypothetical protein LJC19_02530 [Oxalobacter sp. OttesenSCG-928-P03]|nr:hypothetical protein [Oxalobacter sp. OttesenSCG-928-P03]
MLSSTYAQVAMQLENDCLREDLLSLRGQVRDFCDRKEYSEDALEMLLQFTYPLRKKCCQRRLEVHFLPGMRRMVPESGAMMDDHDALHQTAISLHDLICLSLNQALADRRDISAELKAATEQYCQNMFQMLDREENHIFPMAQEKISREGWFSLASAFMWNDDSETAEHVAVDLQRQNFQKYCSISINEIGGEGYSGLKCNLTDKSGLQGSEVPSPHLGNRQPLLSNLAREHGRQAI